ncbi:hypothetical protein VTG60DRAFT_3686 [Thermothelomyces hinnuleus]
MSSPEPSEYSRNALDNLFRSLFEDNRVASLVRLASKGRSRPPGGKAWQRNTGTRLRSGRLVIFAQRSVPKGNDLAVGEVKRGLPYFSSYNNLESQFQQLERAGILDPDIFSATGPQTFPSQPAAPHGPPPGFHVPELPSQARGYAPRSYGYLPSTEAFKGFPRSFPLQAHDAGRPVNIVLPNGGTESLLILSGKVERLEHEVQEAETRRSAGSGGNQGLTGECERWSRQFHKLDQRSRSSN